MPYLNRMRGLLLALGLLLGMPCPVSADQLRLHYVPAGPGGTATLQAGPAG